MIVSAQHWHVEREALIGAYFIAATPSLVVAKALVFNASYAAASVHCAERGMLHDSVKGAT